MEDVEGLWLGFGSWILICIRSLVFDKTMIKILALYLDFEGAKNINVLSVLIWGLGGCWRLVTGVWHLDHDFDRLSYLSWIFPIFFISLRLVKAKIKVLLEAQFMVGS